MSSTVTQPWTRGADKAKWRKTRMFPSLWFICRRFIKGEGLILPQRSSRTQHSIPSVNPERWNTQLGVSSYWQSSGNKMKPWPTLLPLLLPDARRVSSRNGLSWSYSIMSRSGLWHKHWAMPFILLCVICTFPNVGFLWLMGEVKVIWVISKQTSPSVLHLASTQELISRQVLQRSRTLRDE